MKSIAVIPARSGSKGLKDKNIKLLDGKPLIWHTIRQALESRCFDEVFVSTDSEEYRGIAEKCGANVPFLRSEKLASDQADTWDAVQEALDGYRALGKTFDTLMLLQPTSPLRKTEDIIAAFSLLGKNNANSIISLTEMEHSPLWSNTLPSDGRLDNFIIQEYELPRQMLPKYYRVNGAIYLTRVDYFETNHDIYRENSYAYLMDRISSIDIDDEIDFGFAEYLLKRRAGERERNGE